MHTSSFTQIHGRKKKVLLHLRGKTTWNAGFVTIIALLHLMFLLFLIQQRCWVSHSQWKLLETFMSFLFTNMYKSCMLNKREGTFLIHALFKELFSRYSKRFMSILLKFLSTGFVQNKGIESKCNCLNTLWGLFSHLRNIPI